MTGGGFGRFIYQYQELTLLLDFYWKTASTPHPLNDLFT